MIDDVLVFGKNQEEHNKHLTVDLGKIQRAGLTLNEGKCQFSKDRITFLGKVIDDGSGMEFTWIQIRFPQSERSEPWKM